MSKEENLEQTAELEINNVKDLEPTLAAALEKSKDNKPSDAEVEAAQAAYDAEAKDFNIRSWDIGEADRAQVLIDYLNHYMTNRMMWSKNGWMGVLKMDEELKDAEQFIKMNPGSPVKLGYQALEFMFYSLQNPGGVGLQAAKDFAADEEIYAEVFDSVGKNIELARADLKNIQLLQDQYAAMAQGFYLEVEDGIEEQIAEEKAEDEIEDSKE